MTKRSLRFFATSLGVILLMGILAACGAGTSTGTTSNSVITIKIATDLPVSGSDASSGKPAENGAHLAVDQANKQNFLPGYKFVFDPQDDVGASGVHDPSVGAKNVTSLIGDAQVAGIVGPFNSSVAQAEMPIANEAPIALISPANTNTCLTQTDPATGCTGSNLLVPKLRPTGKVTYFRIATTDNHQGGVGADYAYKTLGLKTAYVIDDTELYGVGLANAFVTEFKTDGGTILGHDSIASTTDYTQELTKIANLHPAVLYFAGLDSTGGITIAKQMATTPGLAKVPMMGGDGLQTSAFANAIGSKGVTVYSTVAAVDPTKLPSAANFISQYNATYGPQAFGAYSASGYDCAWILMDAVKAAIQGGAKAPATSSDSDTAKTFRQAVIDQIQKTDYNGVTGHQSFDANGDTTDKIITVYQLADVNGAPGWKYVTAQTLP
ncbi:MAG TPA: branched-chain amino acid ABC transporter substrate-binding protein [Ktedonobacteraceae bacterium]|jgi:branched-chain amino acid transport system substrate-binding protein|nr:branched-chain amino acid ABC transporter substrate-binding protein [Ktedonobacteraceae bacterium]